MKKVLFASTALVAFTGAAAADVDLSGRAEMGIFQTTGLEAQFFTDIDVTFTMSGTTDGGLSFGASVDLDEGGAGAAAVADNSDDGGIVIFISGGFGTVTMGDTDGAMDWALTEAGNVGNPGSLADDETSHAAYVGDYLDGDPVDGTDGQILRYDYTSGAFGVAISAEQSNEGVTTAAFSGDLNFAVGFKYTADLGGASVKFGLGYQEAGVSDALGISVDTTLASGLSLGVVYADWDDAVRDSNLGIGVGYTTGPISVHANYGSVDLVGGGSIDGFGLAAAYDLGGGAVVHFGYGQDDSVPGDFKRASLGLGLSF
ncbi:MAG: porin [Pseudomonadota bacterium]